MDPFNTEQAITQSLGLVVFQVGLLSGIIKLAIDNVKAAIENPSHWPEVTLGVAVVSCFAFEYGVLQIVMQKGPVNLFGLIPTLWLDFVITGLAIAGGAGKFADMLKKATQKKQELHELKVKNGG